jgi:hypothetical protein
MGSKNNEAWEALFQRFNILREVRRTGLFEIDAKTIKTVREPRLMSKFDHKTNLPEIFKTNGLAILPITRSRYVIGEFDAYQTVAYNPQIEPTPIAFPDTITSIQPSNLYSESVALHCAYVSGMVDHLLAEIAYPTISGRMSSRDFDFLIKSNGFAEHRISVSKSQIEIDAGYESESKFVLIEAKNESTSDFLIRQLYYPYRLWTDRLTKEIVPVFFTYSNDVFSFFVYKFTHPHRYNSLRLVFQKDYVLNHEDIKLDDIIEILSITRVVREPRLPFPQADIFERVVDLLGILVDTDMEKDDITANYAFDERQTNYYTTAGMYLGLIEKFQDTDRVIRFRLTRKGHSIMRKPYKNKYLGLASCILEHDIFQRVLKEYFEIGHPLNQDRIVKHMRDCNLYRVSSESTYYRRAQTISKWVDWILSLQSL